MIIDNLWQSAGITTANDLIVEQNNLTSKYGSYILSQVKSLIENDANLSQVQKYLLRDSEAYLCMLLITCKDSGGNYQSFSDAPQIVYALKLTLKETENKFIDLLIDDVLASNSISISSGANSILSITLIKSQVVSELKNQELQVDNPDAQVLNAYYRAKSIGPYNYIVECFLNTGEVQLDEVDDELKQEMARYLYTLNLNLDSMSAAISNGQFINDSFDGYLSQAWSHALRVKSGDNDPINQVFGDGNLASWNGQVDYFEGIETQELKPANIKFSAALYYILWFDFAGVFDAVNSITLKWAQGALDVTFDGNSGGDTASKLYKYFKRNDSRLTKEERMMIYRQVFGIGNVPVIHGGMENHDFQALLDNLMDKVVDYISKVENNSGDKTNISIEGISHSMLNLGSNVGNHSGGKIGQDTHELYAQLQDCFSILKDPEIAAQLAGGRNKSMWEVLKKVLREMGRNINIPAYKTAAIEGNRLLNIIANFQLCKKAF